MDNLPEIWLRGPVPGIPPLLQPVAHALLQARKEVDGLLAEFPDNLLWAEPAGVASVGFHLQHLAGIGDRLFTYARGESLTEEQLDTLASEKEAPYPGCKTGDLLLPFYRQVDKCLQQLAATKEETLLDARGVGRAQLPSTVIGLLVHCAEHTLRHVGQLLVTVRVLTV